MADTKAKAEATAPEVAEMDTAGEEVATKEEAGTNDAPVAEEESGRRSTRERKQRVAYKPVETQDDDDKGLEVPDGAGEELGEIENVKQRLSTYVSTSKFLVKIHTILFPKQRSQKNNRKANIRKFKGFAKDDLEDAKNVATARLEACIADDLKSMCLLFDIAAQGTKAAIVERLVDFLASPVSSGKEYVKGTKKRKGSVKAAKKGKKAKKVKVPKALSGYLYFSTQKSKAIRAKDTDLGMGAVSKKVGLLWGKLDTDEKEEWKQKSIAAFEANGGAKAKKPKKAKKEAEEEVEEEDSDESDDEPLAPAAGLPNKMEARLKEILECADLAVTTRKIIRKELEKDFDKVLVKKKKDEIKAFVDAFVSPAEEE